MAIEFYTTPTLHRQSRNWGIVLAGGEGKRLKSFIKSEFGKEYPKQFCAIVGSRSMFQHTIDRARMLIPDEQVLAVVNYEHLLYSIDEIKERDPKTTIIIPSSRETGPSILLPLLTVCKNDPAATVAIFPSDHFIFHEEIFMEHIAAACEFVESAKDHIVVVGAAPDKAHHGYGWIKKGEAVHYVATSDRPSGICLYNLDRFLEKPNRQKVERAFSQGWLVNTMVLVGKAMKLLNLFKEHTPELYDRFLRVRQSLGKKNEASVVREVFKSIPAVNFSDQILEHVVRHICVMPLNDVYWNDWGEEERILEDMIRFNLVRKTTVDADLYMNAVHHTIELSEW